MAKENIYIVTVAFIVQASSPRAGAALVRERIGDDRADSIYVDISPVESFALRGSWEKYREDLSE